MKQKPYPAYIPSGVEWLGDVPTHWEVKRLKYSTSINDETLPETTDPEYEILYIDIGSINPSSGIEQKELMLFENAPSRARRVVRHGDTIVSTVRTYLRAIAPVKNAERNLVVSTGFAVIRPRTIDNDFLAFALRAPYFIDTVVSRSVGVSYPAINASEIGHIDIPIPAILEQQTIAAFLDCKTGRIDTLVAKKYRLIELLREKRSTMISHAVTKGIDPSVKLKPSGVDWLGDVPEHWEVKKLKLAFWLSRGVDLPSESFVEGLFPVYGSNGVIGYHDKYTTEGPCVVVGRSGSVGEVNYVEGCFWAHNTALYIQDFRGIIARYSYYLLLIIDLKSLSAGSAVGTLNRNYIHDVLIAVPQLLEQQAIAAFLDHETGKIDALIAKVEDVIVKLKEYRTALISAAVTGKIDVREAA